MLLNLTKNWQLQSRDGRQRSQFIVKGDGEGGLGEGEGEMSRGMAREYLMVSDWERDERVSGWSEFCL